MPAIRVKIIDSNQPEPWFASAWDDGRGAVKTVAVLNHKVKVILNVGNVTYELATEEQYQAYRKQK